MLMQITTRGPVALTYYFITWHVRPMPCCILKCNPFRPTNSGFLVTRQINAPNDKLTSNNVT